MVFPHGLHHEFMCPAVPYKRKRSKDSEGTQKPVKWRCSDVKFRVSGVRDAWGVVRCGLPQTARGCWVVYKVPECKAEVNNKG